MAIYSAVPPPPDSPALPSSGATHHGHHHTPSVASTATLDIEAWTVSALEALSVSPEARGTGAPFSIPLDSSAAAPRPSPARVTIDSGVGGITPPRRPPSRRDSQRRRELVLKGNEGSRQRRRWENDRLAHVPGVQPPEPIDFQVGPTHVVHDYVPYHVAQLWDRGLRDQIEEDRARVAALKRRRQQQMDAGLMSSGPDASEEVVGRVPRELRATAKKTPALKGWVRTLEEPVRQFLMEEDAKLKAAAAEEERMRLEAEKQARAAASEGESGVDTEDEEIVFVGRRNGTPQKSSGPGWKKAHRETRDKGAIDSGVVFDSLGGDESSAFKRWLTHSISDYYGLSSHSATTGTPPRRVVYVGIKAAKSGSKHSPQIPPQLPRPMWELF